MKSTESTARRRQVHSVAAPGLMVATVGAAAAVALGRVTPVPTLMAAIALGVIIGNLGPQTHRAVPGLRVASRGVLRFGIVLLGFRLVLGDVRELGTGQLGLVTVVVASTFLGTWWLGLRLGVKSGLSVLTAVGFAICGASAVAAASGVTQSDEDDAAVAIVLVTLYGSLAVFILPVVAAWTGMDPATFGAWVGSSVHDVGQVVAAASTGGDEALQTAIVVKLSRVLLLAPIIAGLAVAQRRRMRAEIATSRGEAKAPALVPLFVVGFLAAATLRSLQVLPEGLIEGLGTAEKWVLAIALVGLGAAVRFDTIRRVSARPVILGLLAWILIAGISLFGGLTLA